MRDTLLVTAAPCEMLDPTTSQDAARLHQPAVRLGVEDRVSVIGTATRSDMTRLLRSADIVVTTPRQDSSGVVALEAMACGLPVVASEVGALAEAVVDQVTGRLVPPGDVPALALTLRELAANQTRREAFGIAGADQVEHGTAGTASSPTHFWSTGVRSSFERDSTTRPVITAWSRLHEVLSAR